MIYLFDDIEQFTHEDLEAAYKEISPQRYRYAMQYHFESDRKLSVIAYLLLQEALRREYGITEKVDIAYRQSGQPFLPSYPNIHFSISHCRKAVACAISNSPIGIDVEQLQPISEDLLNACCSDDEKQDILASDNASVEFTLHWTQKESYLKMTGTGITTELLKSSPTNLNAALLPGLSAFDRYNINSFINRTKSYVCSICTATNPLL